MTPIWKQASSSAGFYRLRAGLLENNKTVWMFDNEIDWVMRICCVSPYRQAARFAEGIQMQMCDTRPSTSNDSSQDEPGKVFNVRRVSLGV
jgi:hypothetical protein